MTTKKSCNCSFGFKQLVLKKQFLCNIFLFMSAPHNSKNWQTAKRTYNQLSMIVNIAIVSSARIFWRFFIENPKTFEILKKKNLFASGETRTLDLGIARRRGTGSPSVAVLVHKSIVSILLRNRAFHYNWQIIMFFHRKPHNETLTKLLFLKQVRILFPEKRLTYSAIFIKNCSVNETTCVSFQNLTWFRFFRPWVYEP